ncbi:MAG: nitroreductase family protein, partial [Paracoccaceae bacterium]
MLAQFETLNALLQTRYSCRAFLDRPVAHSDIEKIVEAAQRVPSWCNAQPWQLILCEGAQTKMLAAALTEAANEGLQAPEIPFPESYSGKYKHRRSTCGWQLYEAVGVAKG